MDNKVLENNLREKINEFGYELVSFNISNSKDDLTLSLVVDRVEPIDMDAITDISNKINAYLDEIDPFNHPYTLDISSLGVEKPLKVEELDKYVSRYVNVHLINPIEGENIYEGELVEVLEDNIKLSFRIKTRTKVVDIQKSNISKIRLAIKF